LVLLEGSIQDTRTSWISSVDVHQSDEYLYSNAMCWLSASSSISDSPLAFVGVLPVSVPSSALLSIPSDRCREVPLRKALRDRGAERLRVATETEVANNFRIGVWGEVCTLSKVKSDPTAVVYEAVVLYKLKADGNETCRVTASRPLGRPPLEPPAAAGDGA
jgi:hypothetical protein